MRRDRTEDAKNLTVIGGSAALACLLTAGLLFARSGPEPVDVRIDVVPAPAPVAVVPAEPPPAPAPVVAPVSGSPRLYGTVTTRDGYAHRGYIRWDKNEGSWADVLDATKIHDRRSNTTAGIRFGNISRIEALSSSRALFTMKSGHTWEMGARSTDLGTGMRALVVEDGRGGMVELGWRDLDAVDFEAPPEELVENGRLYGTVTTRSGLAFTGYVTWDVDEIYTTDVLDGEERGRDHEIPFGAIETIEREGSSAARVMLKSGRSMVLRGTNDVNSSNNGISVSDPGLGQVLLQWEDFGSLRLHEPTQDVAYSAFSGGAPLRGTVVTESGREFTGTIVWDHDESHGWEMLDGDLDDLSFQVEFSNIARIQKTRRGALVELRDGRTFELEDSNDVDDGNRGILVETDGRVVELEWEEFREVRLAH